MALSPEQVCVSRSVLRKYHHHVIPNFGRLVVEGKTGRLIPPGDAEQMRAAVDATLASPATLQQWSAAARRHVEAGFRIEDEAAALNALYRELLDGG